MRFFGILFIIMLLNLNLQSQTRFSAKDKINLTISGTSTMHDWEMKTTKGSCDATFVLDESGNITGLTKMSFKTSAKSLKSGKDGMDKNAYKALKADANPEISAVLRSATVTSKGGNYTINGKIDLTIAGKTLETDLIAQAKTDGDNIVVNGEKKIDMKDYDMSPPSFMLGTVKTGKDVVLKFNLTLTK